MLVQEQRPRCSGVPAATTLQRVLIHPEGLFQTNPQFSKIADAQESSTPALEAGWFMGLTYLLWINSILSSRKLKGEEHGKHDEGRTRLKIWI